MLTTCWETGLACPSCGEEIILGEEMLYGRHLSCARQAAEDKHKTARGRTALEVAVAQLEAGGRIMLSRAQLRDLVNQACQSGLPFAPVRRPDKALGPMHWYGRITGWSPARVAAGLSAPEVAGLWLDYMDVGRTPPVKNRDLSAIISVITG